MDPAAPLRFAQIAVLAQLGRAGGLYTYRVPPGFAPLIGPGALVRVPFANRSCAGVVWSIEDSCVLPRVRDVAELLDPIPVITVHQRRLAGWIAEYYVAPLSDVVGAMLPPGLGGKNSYVLAPGSASSEHRISAGQRRVLDAVEAAGRVGLDSLRRTVDGMDVDKAVTSLLRRGLLVRLGELAPPRAAAHVVRLVSLTAEGRTAAGAGDGGRAPRQRAVLTTLNERGEMAASDLSRLMPRSRAAVEALVKKGLVAVREEERRRSPLDRYQLEVDTAPRLSPAQRTAHQAIMRSIQEQRPDTYLLHGVTGSGKTEVYLHAVADVIAQGRQAIVMVPEISLTPQAVERFARRFPGRVAVLHSKLSPGERLDEWQRIRHGEVDVVVGPRSALFAPLPHPGLIVVDEEHDASYKQEASPRYHARDAAAVLGRITGAAVVLGSATPDVGTYHAARSGRLRLVELPDRPVWNGNRATARPMPPVHVVDMRQELKGGNRSMFSGLLQDALHETLASGHQALLFLNRRGNATIVVCRDCGFVARCHACDTPLTYHSAVSRLICHRCDHRENSPRTCPVCRSPRIRYLGAGTQRVEEEVTRLLPEARVLRWDRDVTGGVRAHEDIVRQFGKHEADILVGTQMIAKGLDFPLVTLVGVVSADTGLHMPDFRAPERSFQLLTQVAGRAGRAALPSKVVVQTYTPDHYAVAAAKDHAYHRFYEEEMTFRRSAEYPPVARLIRFVYASEVEENCRRSAANLHAIFERAIAAEGMRGIELIGPAPCFISKIKNRYYWQLIARGSSSSQGTRLHALVDHVPAGWVIDVDPVDLL